MILLYMIVKYVSRGCRRQTASTEPSSAAGIGGILRIVICCTDDGRVGMT